MKQEKPEIDDFERNKRIPLQKVQKIYLNILLFQSILSICFNLKKKNLQFLAAGGSTPTPPLSGRVFFYLLPSYFLLFNIYSLTVVITGTEIGQGDGNTRPKHR